MIRRIFSGTIGTNSTTTSALNGLQVKQEATSLKGPLEMDQDEENTERITEGAAEEPSTNIRRSASPWYQHFSMAELSGACGDLGTFIPLYVALSRQGVIYRE